MSERIIKLIITIKESELDPLSVDVINIEDNEISIDIDNEYPNPITALTNEGVVRYAYGSETIIIPFDDCKIEEVNEWETYLRERRKFHLLRNDFTDVARDVVRIRLIIIIHIVKTVLINPS